MKSKGIIYVALLIGLVALMKLFQMFLLDENYRKDKSYKKKNTDQKELISKKEQRKKLAANPAKRQKALTEKKEREEVKTVPKVPNGDFGLLEKLKTDYLAAKLNSLEEDRYREDVVVRYYKHAQDGDKVYQLKDLKYYLHEREATETRGLGSNIIYYGSKVKKEDIQIVALTLLKKGIPLKSIEATTYEWKSNAIEIGTETSLLDAAELSIADIENFKK